MVEQIIWLMSQFYDDDRVYMITGRRSKTVKVNTKKLFGEKTNGAVNPPPYTVQIEVSSKDPQRIANRNQMFMEAYTMSAQAQQFFPLSSLFSMLNLDGKDEILPVIKANEHYQEEMQALQQQLQEMAAQLEQKDKENANLKQVTNEMTSALAATSARNGAGAIEAPNPDESAIIEGATNNFGQQTGMPLPT